MRRKGADKQLPAKTIIALERFFGAIRRTSALTAFTAFFLLWAVFQLYDGYTPLPPLVVALVLTAPTVCSLRRTRKKVTRRLALYEDAAQYAQYLGKAWRFWRSAGFYLTALLLAAMITLKAVIADSPAYSLLICLLSAIIVLYIVRWRLLHCLRRVEITVLPLDDEVPAAKRYDRKRERRHAALIVTFYWAPIFVVYLAASVVFRSFVMFLFLPLIAGILFLLFCLISNPFSRYAALRRRHTSVRILRLAALLAVSVGLSALLTNGFFFAFLQIDSFAPVAAERERISITYNEKDGVYTITRPENREMRILQLTDIHLAGGIFTVSQDKKAISACERLIRETEPDLVIVTGDLAYPIAVQTLTLDNVLPYAEFARLMEQLEMPWTFVYGNHDTEKNAVYTAENMNAFLSSNFAMRDRDDGKQLLLAERTPEVSGRYNQYLRTENSAGKLERVIFLLDSNAYADGGYDCIHDDQVQWYTESVRALSEETGQTVPSFLFCHIPFHEYAEAAAALEAENPQAEYLFGTNGESVSHPEKRSRIFEEITKLGSTQAVFCGHDHLNNFGVRYQGVDLIYGMSIDYIAYPGIQEKQEQRGATLILTAGENFTVEQIPLAAVN